MSASKPARNGAVVRRAFGQPQTYPTIKQPRVRKVITRSSNRVTGLFNSLKAWALVPWESQLERDFLTLLEVDNSVRTFRAQPESLRYELNGKTHRYVPDFRVEYWDGRSEIVEIKMEEKAAKPEMQELFEAVRECFRNRNLTYRVVTDKYIRQEPQLSNAKVLLYQGSREPSYDLLVRVGLAFSQCPPRTLGDLERSLGGNSDLRYVLYSIALRNGFDLDLTTAPLSAETRILSDFNYELVRR